MQTRPVALLERLAGKLGSVGSLSFPSAWQPPLPSSARQRPWARRPAWVPFGGGGGLREKLSISAGSSLLT